MCNNSCRQSKTWILDLGASEHMVSCINILYKPKLVFAPKINLPNGKTASITYNGNVILKNGIHLSNVLYVPGFRHNMLFVNKLVLFTTILHKRLELLVWQGMEFTI